MLNTRCPCFYIPSPGLGQKGGRCGTRDSSGTSNDTTHRKKRSRNATETALKHRRNDLKRRRNSSETQQAPASEALRKCAFRAREERCRRGKKQLFAVSQGNEWFFFVPLHWIVDSLALPQEPHAQHWPHPSDNKEGQQAGLPLAPGRKPGEREESPGSTGHPAS